MKNMNKQGEFYLNWIKCFCYFCHNVQMQIVKK